ncbi:IS66 family insertion sequence element accessory protein TnpA [Massilia pseudoviolaceinigra]|uniref:IS66 family insertion sequence element accessory protein TnpA n=1 Tax=Massilia pseudoviolaceinigra TaxID=3057165 RepID=UPI0040421507
MKSGTAFWMGHVATIEHDGIAASKYARQHGLSVTALRYWCRKLRASVMEVAPAASQFLTLSVVQPGDGPPQSGCILVLAGVRLEMPTLPPPEWLAAVALATPGCR